MSEATTGPAQASDLVNYAIALGDDSVTIGHRLSEWSSNAPFLEEDLALTNVGLDFVGRARMFYSYAAECEGRGRTEDDLAFLRDCRDYRNLLICELPIGDFAHTMARQYLLDAYDLLFQQELADSNDATLAAIAAKAVKESRYHLRRSRDWVLRLGDGTNESHGRIQAAINELWAYVAEFFEMPADEGRLAAAGVAVDRAALKPAWEDEVHAVLAEATLSVPADEISISGGRDGIHTEHLGFLLAEMQFMQRAYPGLQW